MILIVLAALGLSINGEVSPMPRVTAGGPHHMRGSGTMRQAAATITGSVTDTAGAPIENAEVRIAALSRLARTDAQGRYRLTEIGAGTHTLSVRALGFEPATVSVSVRGDDEVVQAFTLRRSLTTLDSVTVRAATPDPRMAEFGGNRRVGLGKFLTRADLEARRTQSMSNIMAAVQGVGIVRGTGNRGWILSRRIFQPGDCRDTGRSNAGNSAYIPDEGEKRMGMRCGCYAQVYLNNTLMNPGQPADPFDVNQFNPDQIEAVEWYATPASTPAKYARLNSGCGVYVMHSRRPG